MVKVYDKKTDTEVTFGELTKDLKTYFMVHSSSLKFKKKEYCYKHFK